MSKSTPDIVDMVKHYLLANGYDGLFNTDGGCACVVDDSFPCTEPGLYCCAGYKQPCDCGEHEFHIGKDKLEEGHDNPASLTP